MFEPLLSLQVRLPEDIERAVLAGDFAMANDMIDRRLSRDIPAMLRERLLIEKRFLEGLREDYTLSREELLSQIRRDAPDFTDDEFCDLQRDGWLDYHYIDGQQRFFKRSYPAILRSNASLARRTDKQRPVKHPLLSPMIEEMKRGDGDYRIKMRASLRVKDMAFIPGETYRVHLPVPRPAAQQHDIVIRAENAYIAPETAPQRTAFFERALAENKPFTVEYEYTQSPRYIDPFSATKAPVYPSAPAPCDDDLAQWPPHIVFTPYLISLAKEIAGGETRPLYLARKIYDYITSHVLYAYMRAYFLIESGAEYAALNLRGDCGLQALLFIALCRILGIPARWQSGIYAAPGDAGSHDWAQFYVEPFGWLFCDCSFGGSAYRVGDKERHDFYFGNLDPYRMVANSAYMQAFCPPKLSLPGDPYDNQRGECETPTRGLRMSETESDVEVVEIVKL